MKLQIAKRNIKYWLQRRTRGWSDDETWNLDYEFIHWINSRFKKYKEQASNVVNLNYHKFQYQNKSYTQLQLIDKVINITDEMLTNDYWSLLYSNPDKIEKNKNEVFDIFKIIYEVMWW